MALPIFNTALRKLRDAAGLTMEDLASAAGTARASKLSVSTVRNYEVGRTVMDVETAAAYAKVLKVDVEKVVKAAIDTRSRRRKAG